MSFEESWSRLWRPNGAAAPAEPGDPFVVGDEALLNQAEVRIEGLQWLRRKRVYIVRLSDGSEVALDMASARSMLRRVPPPGVAARIDAAIHALEARAASADGSRGDPDDDPSEVDSAPPLDDMVDAAWNASDVWMRLDALVRIAISPYRVPESDIFWAKFRPDDTVLGLSELPHRSSVDRLRSLLRAGLESGRDPWPRFEAAELDATEARARLRVQGVIRVMEDDRATALWEGAAVPGDWFAYVDTEYSETDSGYRSHFITRVALIAADHVTDVADPAARIPCASGAPIFLADESRIEDLRRKRDGHTRYDEEHGFCVGLYPYDPDTQDLQVFVDDEGRATGFVIETPSEDHEDEEDAYDDDEDDEDEKE